MQNDPIPRQFHLFNGNRIMIFIPQAESVLLDFAGIKSIQPSGHVGEMKNHVAFFVKLRFFQIRGSTAISAVVNVP